MCQAVHLAPGELVERVLAGVAALPATKRVVLAAQPGTGSAAVSRALANLLSRLAGFQVRL